MHITNNKTWHANFFGTPSTLSRSGASRADGVGTARERRVERRECALVRHHHRPVEQGRVPRVEQVQEQHAYQVRAPQADASLSPSPSRPPLAVGPQGRRRRGRRQRPGSALGERHGSATAAVGGSRGASQGPTQATSGARAGRGRSGVRGRGRPPEEGAPGAARARPREPKLREANPKQTDSCFGAKTLFLYPSRRPFCGPLGPRDPAGRAHKTLGLSLLPPSLSQAPSVSTLL